MTALLPNVGTATRHSANAGNFRSLVQAERRRLFSTNGWWILTVAAVFLPALGTVSVGITLGKSGGLTLTDPSLIPKVMAGGFSAGLIAAVYGALTITSEFRYQTIAQSTLDSGSRRRWITAKLPIMVGAGLSFTVIGQATTLALGWFFLHRVGQAPDLWHGQLLQMTWGTALLGLPSVLWGGAIALVVRSQIGTIVGLILYSMVAESALLQFVPALGKYLPGGAQAAIVDDPTLPYHHPALGWPIFLTWIVLAGALGLRRLQRSDLPA